MIVAYGEQMIFIGSVLFLVSSGQGQECTTVRTTHNVVNIANMYVLKLHSHRILFVYACPIISIVAFCSSVIIIIIIVNYSFKTCRASELYCSVEI